MSASNGDGKLVLSTGPGGVVRPVGSSRRWPIIIVALLTGHVLVMTAAVVVATRSTYTVIPNYYQRAISWDAERAAVAAAAAGATGATTLPATQPSK
jgi:hypothetical protein